ncbi:LLM class flavin-dependent oxidoreductase [Aurantiacibacter hainanensis]|uniref:LLM class flavin-dependent oxidoreductase n=1 Tax=Aurantiacibacter hainanensis TaxID=3076114 RepID=UPI0030C749CD
MKFGIFDHVDDSGLPLAEHLEARLQLAETYDGLGFHAYHVAEHHGTPLGHSPSPSVFLAALAQRTRNLRFGPLVYLLPLYHPLRLIEEVATLDALSNGRLELGYGRGISPIEMGFYGIDMDHQQALAEETFAILVKGLTSERLSHSGAFFRFDDVPMTQTCVQKPHPPLWYGTNSPASASRCARQRLNMVTLLAGERMRAMIEDYRREYAESGGDPEAMPLVGVGRHIVLADTDEEALAIARPAFARWRASFVHLWEARGADNPFVKSFPADWDALTESGAACAGSPARVRDFIVAEAETAGYTYFVAQLAFGDMPLEAARHSAQLFAREVMPAFA